MLSKGYRFLLRQLQFQLPTCVLFLAGFVTFAVSSLYFAPIDTFQPLLILSLGLLVCIGAMILYLSTTCSRSVTIPLFSAGCVLLITLIIVTFAFVYSNIVVAFDHVNDGFRFPADFDKRRWQTSTEGRQYMVRNYSLYYSAITYFTVGYGDMHPLLDTLRLLAAFEAMTGYVVSIFIITVGVSNIVNQRNRGSGS